MTTDAPPRPKIDKRALARRLARRRSAPATCIADHPEVVEVLGDLLSEQEVAVAMGRSEQSVAKFRTEKGLPYVRIKGHAKDSIRLRLARVKAWCARHGIDFEDPTGAAE